MNIAKASTINDVAKLAGVSQSTVSLVINQKKHVSEKTRQKILRAMEELKYHPRRSARGLATKRSGNVGFILTEDHFSRSEPFYTKVFIGSEFEARRHDYYVLLTTVPKTFRKGVHVPRFLLEKNVDGVVLAGHVPQALVDYIGHVDLPMVFVDFSPSNGRFTSILIDNETGAFEAVSHLIDSGHKKIAFLGGEISQPNMCDRKRGYERALRQHNIAINTGLIIDDEDEAGVKNGYQAASALLRNEVLPSAIFACNDAMAIGCMRFLQENHIAVPDDISIVGFDDFDQDLLVEPNITTVRVDKEELGGVALRRLVEMIDTGKYLAGKVLTPVELIVRESTRNVSV